MLSILSEFTDDGTGDGNGYDSSHSHPHQQGADDVLFRSTDARSAGGRLRLPRHEVDGSV